MLCDVRVMDVTGGLTRPETTCGGGHCHLSLSLLLVENRSFSAVHCSTAPYLKLKWVSLLRLANGRASTGERPGGASFRTRALALP
jgi:hypothetical protein